MEVTPFRAVRPANDKVHLVATRSYVSYTTSQLKSKLNENPYSFLHILHPEFSKGKLHLTKNLSERFEKIRSRYLQFLEEGILLRDESPAFYIYRQTQSGQCFTGIIGAISIKDYNQGKIKKHELTLAKRESTFTEYLDITGINAEPVLLVNQNTERIHKLLHQYTGYPATYKFTTTDKKLHEIWMVAEPDVILQFQEEFGKSDAFYIADGHHRCSSSANLSSRRINQLGDVRPWDHCLAFIIDESEVKIHEFNRIVKNLGEHSPESFLESLHHDFFVENIHQDAISSPPQTLRMYLNKRWYSLRHKGNLNLSDTEILSRYILAQHLGIHDLRKDKRIEFCEGPKGVEYIRKKVDQNKGGAGFVVPAVAVQELKRTADMGLTMPPKSTWIEPKLRSGLIVYELE